MSKRAIVTLLPLICLGCSNKEQLMEKKNLINAIAAGLSIAAAMPANAETQVGVGLRYHFGDKAPTLELFIRDVDFRDVNSNSFSSSSSSIDNGPLFSEQNVTANGDS